MYCLTQCCCVGFLGQDRCVALLPGLLCGRPHRSFLKTNHRSSGRLSIRRQRRAHLPVSSAAHTTPRSPPIAMATSRGGHAATPASRGWYQRSARHIPPARPPLRCPCHQGGPAPTQTAAWASVLVKETAGPWPGPTHRRSGPPNPAPACRDPGPPAAILPPAAHSLAPLHRDTPTAMTLLLRHRSPRSHPLRPQCRNRPPEGRPSPDASACRKAAWSAPADHSGDGGEASLNTERVEPAWKH